MDLLKFNQTMLSPTRTATVALCIVVLVISQLNRIECTNTDTSTTTAPETPNLLNATNANNRAYIDKYLPIMWSALKNASDNDRYLLTMRKLKAPAAQLYVHVKMCIINYLNSIEPIALLNASRLLSCGYDVIGEHVGILRMASKKAFRCLNSYKIAISNTYSDAPELEPEERSRVESEYSKCLNDLEMRASTDFTLLKPTVMECFKKINDHGTNQIETKDDGNDETSTLKMDKTVIVS